MKEHRRKDTHRQDESQLDAEGKESKAKAETEKKKNENFASGMLKWWGGSPSVDKTNNAGFALFGGKDGGDEVEQEKEKIQYMHRGSETMSRKEMSACKHKKSEV